MGFDIDKIMVPSFGVDIIFNMNSQTPYYRPSIIYDVDPAGNSIIIAQPHIPFSTDTEFKDLHLTTIVQDRNRKIRLGVRCRQFNIIDNYPLANNTTAQAVSLNYELPITETNIRNAFRLTLGAKYLVKGKLRYKGLDYYTSREFSIKDISLSGIGLLIPKRKNKRPNPLCGIKLKKEVMMGIILIDMDQSDPVGTLIFKARVVRINPDKSDMYISVGLKILNLEFESETLLNRFIHNAQIDELKILSGRR